MNETDLGMVCPWPGIRGSTGIGGTGGDRSLSVLLMLPELRPLSPLRVGVNFAWVGQRLFTSRLVIKVIQRAVRPLLLPPTVSGLMMDF